MVKEVDSSYSQKLISTCSLHTAHFIVIVNRILSIAYTNTAMLYFLTHLGTTMTGVYFIINIITIIIIIIKSKSLYTKVCYISEAHDHYSNLLFYTPVATNPLQLL